MAIAPVEIRHVRLKKSFFGGYRKKRVNELLEEVADSFEEVWREREDLRDRVHQLESELTRHRELETLLRETLVTAEKSVIELKDQARTEAERVARAVRGRPRGRAGGGRAAAPRAAGYSGSGARGGGERLLGEATRVRAL